MKPRFLYFVFCLLLVTAPARAQWQSATYSLKGGWNSLFLHGDAGQASLEDHFAGHPEVLEVWRWNPNPNQVQFTTSPLIPSAGTAEWSTWIRGNPAASTLSNLNGPGAYLVKCSGAASSLSTVQLQFHPLPPVSSWVRNGANFLGFPTVKNGSAYPVFRDYFSTFPAALATNSKIYKYVGGDLGPANPLQVFSTATEPLDRNQAYWFESEVVGNFYGPLEITPSLPGGLIFGRTGSVITVRARNRTDAVVTLTVAPVASEPAPAGQTGISGPVPLTRRTYDTASLSWTETPVQGEEHAFTTVIGPQGSVELSFGINRADPAMTGAAVGAYFASLLRFTDSGGMMDVYLPANALRSSLAGLWLGDVSVTNVSSRVSNPAQAVAAVVGGQVTSLTVSGTGGFGYTDPPAVTIAPPADGSPATATAIITKGSVTGFSIISPGSGYAIASPKVLIAPPPPLPGTGVKEPFPLRTILHVSDEGTASLLSQVFVGTLAVAPNPLGICTREELLKPDVKSGAQRLVAANLPLDQIITAGSGAVAVPGILTRTVTMPYNDPVNPFLHQYHPDHDNRNARFQPIALPEGVTAATATMSDGVEAPAITRVCTFTFTAAPPAGGSAALSAWGSSVIGGTYSETITGVHKLPLQVDGTFELRRASEIGLLSQ